MKTCSKCKKLLEDSAFYKNSQSNNGMRPSCIECDYLVRAAWRNKNRDRIKKVTTEYRKNNMKYYSNISVKSNRKMRETSESFRAQHRCRGLITRALKLNYINTEAAVLLGCSISEYKRFIEGQFRDGMTWENKGTVWEIDHIEPLRMFDCSDEHQAKKAFNFKNTQVLFKEEHKQKTSLGK